MLDSHILFLISDFSSENMCLNNFNVTFRVREKRRKKRGVDYNAEIPFEKKPAPGKHKSLKSTKKLV